MVTKKGCLYVFIGQDPASKDARLKKIKEEFLPKNTENFNLDVLYAKELDLFTLQEKILSLPLNASRRIIIIKDSQNLKEDIKGFLLKYAEKPYPSLILILDITQRNKKDAFISRICAYAQVSQFKEPYSLDTFALNRQIELRKTDAALRILAQLIKEGERPERIMGGLRYAWDKHPVSPPEVRKRLTALLNCDIDIKTGRLKPDLALEKLVFKLCGFPKLFR